MANIFSGSEIVEMGIQIEINGKDFYDSLISQAKKEKAKSIFRYLAGEEEKHISTFQKLLDSVEKYEPAESYPGEYFAYMNALAGEHVFTKKDKGKEMARGVKTEREVIEVSIGFEKDSIIFYEGMRKVIPEHDMSLLDELILEEQSHIRQLTDLKKNLRYGISKENSNH